MADRGLWRRVGGSLLIGLVFGPSLDFACQMLVFQGDDRRTYLPVFGFTAVALIVYCFWNRFAVIRMHGLFRPASIGALIGAAAGALVGALTYPPLRAAMGRRWRGAKKIPESLDASPGWRLGFRFLCRRGIEFAPAGGKTGHARTQTAHQCSRAVPFPSPVPSRPSRRLQEVRP
jgi:hypothetical protein